MQQDHSGTLRFGPSRATARLQVQSLQSIRHRPAAGFRPGSKSGNPFCWAAVCAALGLIARELPVGFGDRRGLPTGTMKTRQASCSFVALNVSVRRCHAEEQPTASGLKLICTVPCFAFTQAESEGVVTRLRRGQPTMDAHGVVILLVLPFPLEAMAQLRARRVDNLQGQ